MQFNPRIVVTTFVSTFLLLAGWVGGACAQQPDEFKDLLALQLTTPEKRFHLKRKENAFHFMGIRSFTLDVPGIVGGQFNSIVRCYGVEPIRGTSDVIRSAKHQRAQTNARLFAEKYNRILLNYIVNKKLISAKSPAMKETRQLEIADVKADVQTAIRKQDFRLLGVFGFSSKAVGVPLNELKSVERYKTRFIGQSIKTSKGAEAKQLKTIARSYAAEYNYYLLNYLSAREKS